MVRKAAIAILMCAVMVLVAAAPLAMADTHTVIKGAKGPRASAVTWEYTPASYGLWTLHVTNYGLRSLMVDVYDITTGAPEEVMHQTIRFAAYDAYPTGAVDTGSVIMGLNHLYSITVTPSGPKGSYCTVDDVFQGYPPIVIITIVSVEYLTVVVDGSLSDFDGTIVSYDWDFGDGSSATGVTATHTYAAEGTYTITLTVTDNAGLTLSDSKMVTVHSPPPISSFTVTVNGLTVNVDASASTGYGNLSYAWDWGDGTNGTGMIASHTYAPFISAPTASKDLAAKDRPVWPPHAVFGYTYTVNGTELPGCYVTVTNVRTGEFVVYNETREYWDPNANVYMVDMTEFMLGYAIGDPLNITATKGDLIGWAEGCVSDYGFTQIDVILNQSGSFKMVTITLTVTDMMGRSASVSQTVTLTTPPVDMRTVLYEPFDSYASLDPGWSFWNYSGMDYNHFEVRNGTLFATNAPGLGAIDSRNAYANWTGLISYNETLSISFSIYLPTESDYKQGAWGQWPGLVLYDSSGRLMLFTRWLMDTWSGAPSGWAYIDSTSNWAGVCSFTAGWHQVEIVMNKTMTTWTAVFDGISHPGLSYTGMTSFGFDISKLSFVNGLREETTVVMIDDLLIEVNGPLNATRPVAFFSTSLSYLAVTVDGSGSYDPDGTIVSCEWAFGDGSNATGVNATHTYTAAGTYTIVLTVTDNDGNTAWSRQQVTLVPDLVASFNFTVEGLSVNVDASSSRSAAGIVSYQWDWGDGTTGTGVTASHSYAMPTSASTESQALSEKSRTPPHAIFGLTYAADGVTALPGCIVTITNVRTGEIIVWDETREGWTPTDNIYSIDVAEFVNYGWRFGDILNVNATKGAYIGWAEAPITDNPWGYDQIDVVLYPTNVVVRTVTLTVTDTMGQTSTVSKTVTLYY